VVTKYQTSRSFHHAPSTLDIERRTTMINEHQLTAQEPNSDSAPLLLNLIDAGRLLGVSKWTMYELMHSGVLPSVRIQSRRFIAKDDLDKYVLQLRAEAGERHGL
jgi:excisionase family DNA binding protein